MMNVTCSFSAFFIRNLTFILFSCVKNHVWGVYLYFVWITWFYLFFEIQVLCEFGFMFEWILYRKESNAFCTTGGLLQLYGWLERWVERAVMQKKFNIIFPLIHEGLKSPLLWLESFSDKRQVADIVFEKIRLRMNFLSNFLKKINHFVTFIYGCVNFKQLNYKFSTLFILYMQYFNSFS
jgi:hypothetical protein